MLAEPIATVVAAALVALLTSTLRFRQLRTRLQLEHQAEVSREQTKQRIHYLDPLRVSAANLLNKLFDLRADLPNNEQFWRQTFKEIKTRDRSDAAKHDLAFWCNGYGAGAMTTLYVTLEYFAHASRLRGELPFLQLGPSEDLNLLNALTDVRRAFGGSQGLWGDLQDSLGAYVRRADGGISSYRDFCMQVIDPWDHIWFTRLIDFYGDIHLKQEAELARVISALTQLTSLAEKLSASTWSIRAGR